MVEKNAGENSQINTFSNGENKMNKNHNKIALQHAKLIGRAKSNAIRDVNHESVLHFDNNSNHVNVLERDADFYHMCDECAEDYLESLEHDFDNFIELSSSEATVSVSATKIRSIDDAVTFVSFVNSILILEQAELIDVGLRLNGRALLRFRCPVDKSVASVKTSLEQAIAIM